jgi:DNA-directed RNA polymerase specialized sigma24 family protein
MKDALFCLPPFYRLLIFLCDKEGYKYLQISRILNINVEEVIAGLSLARKKIEEIYSKIS